VKTTLAAVLIALTLAAPVRSQESKPACRKEARGGSC